MHQAGIAIMILAVLWIIYRIVKELIHKKEDFKTAELIDN